MRRQTLGARKYFSNSSRFLCLPWVLDGKQSERAARVKNHSQASSNGAHISIIRGAEAAAATGAKIADLSRAHEPREKGEREREKERKSKLIIGSCTTATTTTTTTTAAVVMIAETERDRKLLLFLLLTYDLHGTRVRIYPLVRRSVGRPAAVVVEHASPEIICGRASAHKVN